MLTRFIKIQLTVFAVASVVGIATMVLVYMQVPTLVGFGRITVKLELPAGGGLYRFSNVTYRGVQIGEVTAISLTDAGAEATLSLTTNPRVPSDLQAEVRSISAVGEQYVDLRPRTDSSPYLTNGSVITVQDSTIPQQVGPMLDRVSALVASIPKDKLSLLFDESFKGLNGAGDDIGSLFDSVSTVANDANNTSDHARTLIDDTVPFLDAQAQTIDSIRTWTKSLAGFTGQLVQDDPQLRTVLQTGPGAVQEAARLLEQVKPTLPILLANLTSIGQVAVTYHASLEQLLVLLPPYVASGQAYSLGKNNPTGLPQGSFSITLGDPPACTVGFLPPSQWRSPADLTDVDTPDGLYCKLPQDSPIAVRGARNYPCQGVPGKRAPTVQLCNSDRPYVPLAQRQHVTGPYPFDPNLISQGYPPDDRVNSGSNLYAPVDGTPLPATAPGPADPSGAGGPPGAANPPLAPADMSPGPSVDPPMPTVSGSPVPTGGSSQPDDSAPSAAPSSSDLNVLPSGQSVGVAEYDPRTGQYATPDGHVFRQADLVTTNSAKSWKGMLPN